MRSILYCPGNRTRDRPRDKAPHGAPAPPRRARAAVVAFFVVLGLADGVWLARIPAVKQHLGFSDGLLGVALLAPPAGLVLVAAFADRLIDRFGSARPTVALGLLALCCGSRSASPLR